jgi:predicted RecA/RadA family phage recombinase
LKNFVQQGKAVYVPAPSPGVNSGDLVVVGSMFGVAGFNAATGAIVPLWNEGIFSLPKLSTETWTSGLKIYWDSTNKRCTSVAGANMYIGVATALAPNYTTAAASGAAFGDVRLNPSF